jgi:hypothetical protein
MYKYACKRCTPMRCTYESSRQCIPRKRAYLWWQPPKISHTGCHCVGWHAVVCYGAPEWFRGWEQYKGSTERTSILCSLSATTVRTAANVLEAALCFWNFRYMYSIRQSMRTRRKVRKREAEEGRNNRARARTESGEGLVKALTKIAGN